MADKQQHGVLVSGLVISKKKYPGKDGKPDRFGVDVAVPGIREMLSIQMPPERWGGLLEMSDFKGLVTFRVYKGIIYFEAL